MERERKRRTPPDGDADVHGGILATALHPRKQQRIWSSDEDREGEKLGRGQRERGGEMESGRDIEEVVIFDPFEALSILNIRAEHLLNFQKEAIFRQMNEYKRMFQRAEQRLQEVDEQRKIMDISLAHLTAFWAQLHDHLNGLLLNLKIATDSIPATATSSASRNPLSLPSALSDPTTLSKFLHNALQGVVETAEQLEKEVRKAVQAREDVERRVGELGQGGSTATTALLREENARLLSLRRSLTVQLETLHATHAAAVTRTTELEARLEIMEKREEEAREKTDQVGEELRKAERRVERWKAEADKAKKDASAGVGRDLGPVKSEGGEMIKNEEKQAPSLGSNDNEFDSAIAERRLADIHALQRENGRLRTELDECRVKLTVFADDRVFESPPYRAVQAQMNQLKSELERDKLALDKALKEVEELRSERRKGREQIESEEHAHRRVLESELRRLESDLVRLRGERDNALQTLALRVAKDNADIIQNHEIKVIANSRKDRIVALEAEVQRLRMSAAADAGDNSLFELCEKMTGDEEALKHLQDRLAQREARITELTATLRAYEEATKDRNILQAQDQLRKEISLLQTKLQQYEDIVGPPSSLLNPALPAELTGKLRTSEMRIKELEQQLEQSKKMEGVLLSEIDSTGRAWSLLEEQNSRKVLDLTEKEEQIIRALADRTKAEQKLIAESKRATSYQNMAQALKRQSEKQLEALRRVDDARRNLEQQLVISLRLVKRVVMLLSNHRHRVCWKKKMLRKTQLLKRIAERLQRVIK
ncbi:E3 ubiquitin-protein ligase bre1 [Gonapodya sp. JEL0774]|nr:E3 ubiquitin-protein ligase bre1 [Gonapodya sp. JEL0774]